MFAGGLKTCMLFAVLVSVVAAPAAAASDSPVTSDAVEESLMQGVQPEVPPSVPVTEDEDIHTRSETSTEIEVPRSRSDAPAPAASTSRADLQSFKCQNGFAGPFPCENVDLESLLPLGGAGLGNGNDVWGWTDPKTDREYALVGSALATAFVDVTDPQNPVTVGYLPTTQDAPPNFVLWRDVKVDGNWAFIVSEIRGHGMQIFDLTRLRDAAPVPQIFTEDVLYRGTDEAGRELGNAHNVAINEATDFAYIVGSNTCVSEGGEGENGGLHMVDISDPRNPKFAGCALVTNPASNNYIHDVQCVVYRGPDADYRGREICFGSNESVVAVYDVTDKDNPVVISQWGYPTASYTHQGWLTPDHRYFLFGDEGDEQGGTVDNTTTYIMDASDLDRPRTPTPFFHDTLSIDHNLFIRGNLVYEANYGEGLRILEFSNRSLSNGQLNEVGFFDIRPGFDAAEFVGTWSNYPYFKSGIVVMTGIEEGTSVLYVLRPTGKASGAAGGAGSGGGGSGGGSGGSGGGGGGGGGGSGGGGSGGGGSGGSGSGGSGGGGEVLAQQEQGGGGALSSTGATVLPLLLLALALIGAGAAVTALQKHRGPTEGS